MAQIPSSDLPVVNPATGRINLEWYAALQRIVSEIGGISSGGVTSVFGRTGNVVAVADDYAASEIENDSGVAGAQVSDALDTLDANKAEAALQIIAGAGLTDGGDLTADVTLNVGAGTGITVNADSVALNTSSTRNTDHAGVTLSAGAGLTGGGDISSSRSFAVGAGTGITVNADDVAIADGGVGTTQLADEGVTNAKLSHAAAWTIKMRNAGTAGDPSDAAEGDITAEAAPSAGDFVLGFLSGGEIRKYDVTDLPGGGGGGIVSAIADGAVSAAATLDIALGSADMYEIDLINFRPATDNQVFQMRFSQSGSILSGAADYGWLCSAGGNGISFDNSDTRIAVTTTWGNLANELGTITFRIYRPSAGSFRKTAIWYGGYTDIASNFNICSGHGALIGNTNAIDGVRFMFGSGNIAEGYYAVRAYSFT